MNTTNNTSARNSYDIARELFFFALRDKFPDGPDGDAKCRKWVNSLKLTQGEVRLEVELNTTNNIFTFGVTPNQTNSQNLQFITERRLPLQDSICVNEWQFFVGKPSSRDDVEWPLRTYGNTVDFTAAAAAAIDGTLLAHGWLTLKVNNDVLIPYRGLQNFLYRGQTQQTAALGAGSPNDQLRGAEDSTITSEPNIVLIGSKGSIPQIELPGNLATVDAFTRAVLIGKGVYAQNSTVVN